MIFDKQDAEAIAQQMFQPLILQLITWVSIDAASRYKIASALLDCCFENLCDPQSVSLCMFNVHIRAAFKETSVPITSVSSCIGPSSKHHPL